MAVVSIILKLPTKTIGNPSHCYIVFCTSIVEFVVDAKAKVLYDPAVSTCMMYRC